MEVSMRKLGKLSMVVGLSALAALTIASCGRSSSGKEGGHLTVSFASYPDALDPQFSYTVEGWSAMYDTYIPLLTFAHAEGEAGSKVVPGLASALPKVTDGGKTYTLSLAKGVKYSDGTQVEASDFKASVERMFNLNSSGSFYYEVIDGAAAFAAGKAKEISGIETDDKTGKIVIHLTEPMGAFNDLLALLFTAPVPADTPHEVATKTPPPATGPYEIVNVRPGKGWSYVRNPQWEKNNAALMPEVPSGHVDTIDAKVTENQSTQVNDVEQGHTNWMFDTLPPDRVAEVKSKYEGTQYRTTPGIGLEFIWMNTTQPPFDNLKVRQAVNYAINPVQTERIFAGEQTATQQIIPPGVPGYQKLNLYPYDLAKAKQLLKEAHPSDLDVTFWTENLEEEPGESFVQVLNEIGFHAKLKVVNSENYFTVIGNEKTPDLDLGFAGFTADYPDPNAFFEPLLSGESIAPTNNTNLARIDNPQLTKKISQLATEPIGPQQEKEYAALDRAFMEEAPFAPYGNPISSLFVSSDIDFEDVIWNPIFSGDLTSFQFK
jgi:peptide/nickel transport system substrate-binding protein